MYVIETKNGYIKKFTLIFDKECDYLKEAAYFTKPALDKFFMFRDRKKYRVYQINVERSEWR